MKKKPKIFVRPTKWRFFLFQFFSCKGWNWGKVDIEGDELAMTLDDGKIAFEVPLGNVSNCNTAKNELTLEFHQNEDVNQITMMECRFHMPPGIYRDVFARILKFSNNAHFFQKKTYS